MSMTTGRKITGPMAAWVDAQIAAGRFATEDDAIEAGLVALADRDQKIQNRQRLIQEGLDALEAGDVYEYDSPEALAADIRVFSQQVASHLRPAPPPDHPKPRSHGWSGGGAGRSG